MNRAEKLIALYSKTAERLLEQVRQLEEGSWNRRRKEELLRQVDEIVNQLAGDAGQQMATLLGEEYMSGVSAAVANMTSVGIAIESLDTTVRPLIHQQAVQAIMDESFYSILEASEHMSRDAKKRIEDTIRMANERSLLEGVNRRKATKQAIADLNSRGITGMVAKNGAQIPADKYMAGVVHYHQRKAHVTGTENMAAQNGYDLVYINFVGITCEYCAKYQGRVYSISGNDKRFPKLEIRPPYHSHCVHSLSVWIEEYTGPEEIEKMIRESNRPFVDNRTEKNIKRYKQVQINKSRKNATRKQWIRYKSTLPNDTPDLKTFASQKARDTAKYLDLQKLYREANVINSKAVLPKNSAAISLYRKDAILVKERVVSKGPEWKHPDLAETHLAKRIKRKQIPKDWTLQVYEEKVKEIVKNPTSQMYRYRQDGFNQDYYVFGDGKQWISIVGQDGKMETAFPFDKPADYRNYLTIDKGYTYMGTVKEVVDGAD